VNSAGGVYGSLGMPGSCHHRMGHYPLRPKPLDPRTGQRTGGARSGASVSASKGGGSEGNGSGGSGGGGSGEGGGGGGGGGGRAWLEYVPSSALDRGARGALADAEARKAYLAVVATAPEFPLVPGPFVGVVPNAGMVAHSGATAKRLRLEQRERATAEALR